MMNKNILRNLIDYLIFIILGAAHGTLYWKLMMYTANYKSVKLMYASIIGMTVVTFLVVMITVKVIKVKWPALKCLCGFIMSEIAAIGFIRFNYIHAEELNNDGLGVLILAVMMQILYVIVGIEIMVFLTKEKYVPKES